MHTPRTPTQPSDTRPQEQCDEVLDKLQQLTQAARARRKRLAVRIDDLLEPVVDGAGAVTASRARANPWGATGGKIRPRGSARRATPARPRAACSGS